MKSWVGARRFNHRWFTNAEPGVDRGASGLKGLRASHLLIAPQFPRAIYLQQSAGRLTELHRSSRSAREVLDRR